ncbi:hypothetical protein P167DRAFT_580297 [Morchella conica CCBAS932]|uniref:Uncharacterized protein n=1 Tax=Morchella conica CCBAS932 TaxID=1392247 RepID=A0A3N4KLD9_9PEZI|nr:hypothetical protein P167DRAFT_580297 [Morchella conica CCBAS932]
MEERREDDRNLQVALVKVCVSSTLQDLAKRKSVEDREKFSEAFKEKKRAAKLAKAKAAKKGTKGKATDTEGKGKQREMVPIGSSTKRSNQAQAPLPDDEDKLRIDRRASGIKAEETGTHWGKPTKGKRSEIVELSDGNDDNDDNDDNEGKDEGGGSSSRKKPRGENTGEDDDDGDDDDGDDDDGNDNDEECEEDDDVVDEEEEEKEDEEEEEEGEEEEASRRKKTKTSGPKMPAKTLPSKKTGLKTPAKTAAQTTLAQRREKMSRAHHLFDRPAESPPYESELEEEQRDLIPECESWAAGSQSDSAPESERTTREMPYEEPATEGSYVDGGPDGDITPSGRRDESIDMEVGSLTDASASSIEVAKLQTIPRLPQFL